MMDDTWNQKKTSKSSILLISFPIIASVVYGAMGCGRKSFKLVWLCHQLLSGFLVEGYLPRVSLLSAKGNGNIEIIPGAVHRSLGIYLIAKETRETSARRPSMKVVRLVIA